MKLPDEIKPKPPGYKTIRQWEKEGRIPINENAYEVYAAVNQNGEIVKKEKNGPISVENIYLYEYVSFENTIPKRTVIPDVFDYDNLIVVCFDTETTGLSKWDEILQITFRDKTKELLSTFVKPTKRKTWENASKINGIYPEDVKDSPTASDLSKEIKSIIQNADIIIGHNVSFDIRAVERCMKVSFKDKTILDTLTLFKEDVPTGHHKLIDAVAFYVPEFLEEFENGAHKSDMDVLATMKVFEAQCKIRMKQKEVPANQCRNGFECSLELENEYEY